MLILSHASGDHGIATGTRWRLNLLLVRKRLRLLNQQQRAISFDPPWAELNHSESDKKILTDGIATRSGQEETPPPKPTASNSDPPLEPFIRQEGLGRQQALATGERLKSLGRPYTHILHSTLIRAVETAQLISKSLPDVPMMSTDLLKEGAPIVPEPPSSHWPVSQWVS